MNSHAVSLRNFISAICDVINVRYIRQKAYKIGKAVSEVIVARIIIWVQCSWKHAPSRLKLAEKSKHFGQLF